MAAPCRYEVVIVFRTHKPKTYTAEFQESAVKLAAESDQPVTETAGDLGVNVNTLHARIGK